MAVANVLNFVLLVFMWIVIARAILSWVNPDPYNPIVRFIHNVTEPVLYQIRTKIPINFGGIDLSPILVILAVYFLRDFVVKSLLRFSASLM
jgi:YggT family protein